MNHKALVALAVLALAAVPALGQSLTPEQLAAVRRGAAEASLPDGPLEVPLVGTPTLPLVEARVNGAGPYRLLLDLGSNVTLLRRDVADAAGVEVVLDRERSDIVRADTLTVGSALFRDVWMGAYDELDVDGVIGYNLLGNFPFTFDFPAQRLVLGRSEVGEGDPEYVIEDRLPYFPARIGEREVRLNPDTGAAQEMAVPADWEGKLPVDGEVRPGPVTENNQTGKTQVRVGKLGADLRVGELLVGRPEVYFSPDIDDAWLGCSVLRRYVLSMDPKTRRYRLAPEEAAPHP